MKVDEGEGTGAGDKRVTALHKLTAEKSKNIPTENLLAERQLSKFWMLDSNMFKAKCRVEIKKKKIELRKLGKLIFI